MDFTPFSISTYDNFSQRSKMQSPSVVTVEGILTVSISNNLKKAPSPMEVTPSSIVRYLTLTQFSNADFPIFLTDPGIYISSIDGNLQNALSPIVTSPLLSFSFEIFWLSQKASSPTVFTLAGISSVPEISH